MMKTRLLPIAAMVGIAFNMPAYADTVEAADNNQAETTEVETVTVKGKRQGQVTTERKTRKDIDNEMIRDTRDLVRYSTDVGIADNGRHLKGFAMRGVEGNRVGVSVDGVSVPDFQENSLYSRYGNFNSSRLTIDSELVNNIDVVKGSDSFNSGSGYLGGGVNYRTLSAEDIVLPDNSFGAMIRGAYATKNREWVKTIGAGFLGEKADAVVLYSHRYGHELKSRGYGPATYGNDSGVPDPATHRYNSYLAKLGYQFNDNHRAGIAVNGQHGSNYVDERSYVLSGWREADDTHKRVNANVYYEYQPNSGRLAFLRTEADYSNTEVGALTHNGSFLYDSNFDPIGKEEPFEHKNRKMYTQFKRISLRMDSQPFDFLGSHTLRFKTFVARNDFKNNNHDTNKFGLDKKYSIQNPSKTTQYGFSLLDDISWNDRFSGHIGVRYDHTRVKPLPFILPCTTCNQEPLSATTFTGWSGTLGLNAQMNQTWRTGYHLASGYRVPTASEMYFSFENYAGTWRQNPNLKAERSLTHTLFLEGKNDKGALDVNLYQTNYRNFLFEQENIIENTNPYCDDYFESLGFCTKTIQTPVQQMVNLDKAKVRGIEVKGQLNLGEWMPAVKGLKLVGGLGYSRGKLSNGASLLSIQPLKGIVGLDYEQPDGKWGIFNRLTYTRAKKAEDTKYWKHRYNFRTRSYSDPELLTYQWLNKSAAVFDVYGYVRPNKNLILRAGVYNVFNRKYNTWDTMRGLNEISPSTTNTVDDKGKGLERFYAPGRNYAVSLEYKF